MRIFIADLITATLQSGRLLAVCIALLLLSACDQSKETLKVGSNIWPGYESLYLARESGFLEGQPIELVELPNATRVLQAFQSGDLDVAGLTLDEYLTLLARGYKARVIAIMDYSEGADVLIARPEIQSLQQLEGAVIVLEKTAVGAILLQGALDSANLTVSQVTLKNAPVNQHDHRWKNPEVDAIVTFEPVRSRLLEAGGKVLFDSRQIPGRIVDVLVASEKSLNNKSGQIRHLLNGHFRALTMMMSAPDKAAEIMSVRLKISQDKVWQLFDGLHIPGLQENRYLLESNLPDTLKRTEALKRLMLESDLLNRNISLDASLFDANYLPDKG
ncbi:ABC transporter substrate-binding protein [Oceanospirillum sediminis]|uniref:ABC transporter substrate-binding protein n=1 Tax=Oceanospirillum sediminis TaxID=2760088 RepID=A0A839IRW0_9GAMM|nr:ABC transporter substrate-binding protein [Oceanospirillum sediminis]MBB1486936.1 ABC transporter substrate-binding protein [Oceanospirillum sediminis]